MSCSNTCAAGYTASGFPQSTPVVLASCRTNGTYFLSKGSGSSAVATRGTSGLPVFLPSNGPLTYGANLYVTAAKEGTVLNVTTTGATWSTRKNGGTPFVVLRSPSVPDNQVQVQAGDVLYLIAQSVTGGPNYLSTGTSDVTSKVSLSPHPTGWTILGLPSGAASSLMAAPVPSCVATPSSSTGAPLYKDWWFWLLVAVVVLGVILALLFGFGAFRHGAPESVATTTITTGAAPPSAVVLGAVPAPQPTIVLATK